MEKTLPPDPEETTKFWSDLSGVPVQHDDSKEWIKEIEEKLQKKVQRQADITIPKRDVNKSWRLDSELEISWARWYTTLLLRLKCF